MIVFGQLVSSNIFQRWPDCGVIFLSWFSLHTQNILSSQRVKSLISEMCIEQKMWWNDQPNATTIAKRIRPAAK